jgi:hypothetical protein
MCFRNRKFDLAGYVRSPESLQTNTCSCHVRWLLLFFQNSRRMTSPPVSECDIGDYMFSSSLLSKNSQEHLMSCTKKMDAPMLCASATQVCNELRHVRSWKFFQSLPDALYALLCSPDSIGKNIERLLMCCLKLYAKHAYAFFFPKLQRLSRMPCTNSSNERTMFFPESKGLICLGMCGAGNSSKSRNPNLSNYVRSRNSSKSLCMCRSKTSNAHIYVDFLLFPNVKDWVECSVPNHNFELLCASAP